MRFPLTTRTPFLAIACLTLCAAASAQHLTPVSGYEIFLGRNCTIEKLIFARHAET